MNFMKGVTLYPHIKFLPLEDADGYFGLMMMTDRDDNIVTTATIEDAIQFKDVYARWVCQVQAFITPLHTSF